VVGAPGGLVEVTAVGLVGEGCGPGRDVVGEPICLLVVVAPGCLVVIGACCRAIRVVEAAQVTSRDQRKRPSIS